MKKTTKRFVSFLLSAVMMFSMFTFSAAAAGLDASYDSATDIVTVENIPATSGTHYITVVKGTVALDDATSDDVVAFVEILGDDYSATQELPVLESDMTAGTYTVYVTGGYSTTFNVVASEISAAYDAENNKIVISDIPTEDVDVQTIIIKSADNRIVGLDEFTTVAATQEIPVDEYIAPGEYTVMVGCDGVVSDCTVTVNQIMRAKYDGDNDKIVVMYLPTEDVEVQTIMVKDENDDIYGMEEFTTVAATQEIPVSAMIPSGVYTVYASCGDEVLECNVTVDSGIKAVYDPDTNKVTISDIPVDGVTSQTITIENTTEVVALEEYDDVAATRVVEVLAEKMVIDTYTVKVGLTVDGEDVVLETTFEVTVAPTAAPTTEPTATPTAAPTATPTVAPTAAPTATPTVAPTAAPTATPTVAPTDAPTEAPTEAPTDEPTEAPTDGPTAEPTERPLPTPTPNPGTVSTPRPTRKPSGGSPSGGGIILVTPTPAPTAPVGPNPTVAPTGGFEDMAGYEWANEAVNTLASLGVVNGRSDTVFDPSASVTRAEFTKMVCGAMGLPADTGAAQTFDDVPATHWAYGYIATAVKLGIVEGYSDTEFKPNQLITREQMAAILYRAIVACQNEGKLPEGTAITFDDYASISDYAKASVDALSSAGVIKGVTDTTFVPAATANRAQAASIIYQYYKAIGAI